MSMVNSTVEIKDGKVVFSEEVLSYFENLRNEENSEWIDKYFKVLSDESNLNAEKYNTHHIRPCFTFKDKEHKKRKETQNLGDDFKENIIKLSVYNHLFAHYYLWKIFDNKDSKIAFQRMCGQKQYIDNLTENELKKIAKLKEDCAKKNQTEEERLKRIHNYNHSKNRIEKMKERQKIRYFDSIVGDYVTRETILRRIKLNKDKYSNTNINNLKTTIVDSKEYNEVMTNFKLQKQKLQKVKRKESAKNWINKNKDKVKIKTKQYSQNYKERRKELNNRLCLDPKTNTIITYSMLLTRKNRHKDLYNDVILKNCIIEVSKEEYDYLYENRKPKVNHPPYKKDKNRINEMNKRLCFDPIKRENCFYSTLTSRKYEHKEDYKDVIVKNCLI